MKSTNQMIGCCGLDCEACDARIATLTNDNALRKKTAALWTKLNGVTILPEMINCTGCRVEGAKTPFCDRLCPVHNCVREKGLYTCADCGKLDGCPTLGRIAANSPFVLENLNRLCEARHMKRYIALLRGINISGKNKVPMAELKKCFEALGGMEVKTCLNSGNVIFSSDEADVAVLTDRIEHMIQREFGLNIPTFVIPQEELADILHHAPDWWGTENKEIYDNLIFILPPATFSDIYHEIGAPKEGLEQIQEYQSVVFWTFDRKNYQKTNWWSKTARMDIGSKLTIRTANTIRKIVSM